MLPARSQPWGTRACQSWAAVEMAASSNHGICEILLRSILWRQKTMLHQDLLWDVWVNASSSFFSFFFEFSILESANNCLDARFMMQGWERLPRPVFSRNSPPALDLLNLPTFFFHFRRALSLAFIWLVRWPDVPTQAMACTLLQEHLRLFECCFYSCPPWHMSFATAAIA